MCLFTCVFSVFTCFLVLGNLPVTLWMYKDPQISSRKVPTLEYQQALCEVPSTEVFTIKDNELWIGSNQIGNQLLYTVPIPEP